MFKNMFSFLRLLKEDVSPTCDGMEPVQLGVADEAPTPAEQNQVCAWSYTCMYLHSNMFSFLRLLKEDVSPTCDGMEPVQLGVADVTPTPSEHNQVNA